MGAGQGSDIPKQVLMLGLSKSGKTKFLYQTYAFTRNERDAETRGFNYEMIDTEGGKVGIWDIGGNEIMKEFWPYFYQNVKIDGVIYMIDASSEDSLKRIKEIEQLITMLVHEEELKDKPFAIFFNLENDKGECTPEHVRKIILHPIMQKFLKHIRKLKTAGAKLKLIKPTESNVTIKQKLDKWLKDIACTVNVVVKDDS